MGTNRTTRFGGMLIAVVMTVVTNGAMLWEFDSVALEAMVAAIALSPNALLTLDTVTVVAHRPS